MSEFFDMAASVRENEHMALQHRRHGNYEIETMKPHALFLVGIGVALLWLVFA